MLYASNTFVPYNYALKEADAVFLGIPFTSTSISKPAMHGPVLVRHALKNVENLPDRKFCDIGDIEIVPGSYELTAKRIRETVKETLETNSRAFPILIGGEHLITLPIIEALKPKTIVQIDAHSDTRSDYLGCVYSHATWAYHASKISRITQIGLNAVSDEEKKFLAKTKAVHAFSISDFLKFKPNIEKPVHLTIDMDVFDPSYVEAGFPEGNAKPEDIFAVLDKIQPQSMDIVEIADDRLPSKTAFLAAELIKRVLQNV
ncbi:arginase family protein [Candidatus Woesearchaeota archaeon]|nr:arginase family protein [Candidatus Woesearchaeota archaeon]